MAASRGNEYQRTYAEDYAFVLQGNAGVVNVHYHSSCDPTRKRQRETTFDDSDVLAPVKKPRFAGAHAISESRVPHCASSKKSQEHVHTQQVDHGLPKASLASNLEDRDGRESRLCTNIVWASFG